MTKEQLQIVVGLITGCQTAMITMADHLSRLDVLDKAALADHFENTAAAIPEATQQRELIALVLRQVAQGMRSVKASDPDAIQKLFH